MKFTPDSLIDIYLNGSFTEEAQAEFDRLVRKDPLFAERVTQAVAQRVGPTPASLEGVAANLDSKIDGIWQAHKPSPWHALAQKAAGVVLLAAAGTGVYGIYHHYWAQPHSVRGEEQTLSDTTIPSGTASEETISGGSPNQAPSSGSQRSMATKASPQESEALISNKLPVTIHPNFSTPPPYGVTGAAAGLKGSKPTARGNDSSKPTTKAINGGVQEGTSLTVSIAMEKAQKVIVTVLDSNGLLVRHLYEGPWTAGEHLVDWDGKDEVGNSVLPGNYTVMVKTGTKTLTGTVTLQPVR